MDAVSMSWSTRSAARHSRGASMPSPTGAVVSRWATPGGQRSRPSTSPTCAPITRRCLGSSSGAELLLSPRVHPMIAGHLDAIARGELRVIIDRTYPLADAAEAHAYIESRQSFGRVLLIP